MLRWQDVATPAAAQFGVSVVSDPGAYARMATDLQQAIKEYQAIITLYQLSQQAYANMERAAQEHHHQERLDPGHDIVDLPERHQYLWHHGGLDADRKHRCGIAGGISERDRSAAELWPVWSTLTPAQQDQFGRSYGSVELSDAAAINALRQLGMVRSNAAATDSAIARLASDASSNDPALNTRGGCSESDQRCRRDRARQQQNTNQLLATIVDQQTVQSKLQRDAIAEGIVPTLRPSRTRRKIRQPSGAGQPQALDAAAVGEPMETGSFYSDHAGHARPGHQSHGCVSWRPGSTCSP